MDQLGKTAAKKANEFGCLADAFKIPLRLSG